MRNLLADAPWLSSPSIRRVFSVLEQSGAQARAVGGSVRNTLLGVPVNDIDIATTALPEEVLRHTRAAGLKAVATGLEHGTVTVICDGIPYEVTTLRKDVETYGRHARVEFSADWAADAARRDFTMNALYADSDGTLHDPTGEGYADCRARRVRFIGAPEARIREDYLRILRFFRFHARFGSGEMDADGLSAVIAARDGLRKLSAERVGHEIRKILPAPGAVAAVEAMSDTGILEIALGGVLRLEDFDHVTRLDAPEAADPMLRLAVLACFVEEDVQRLGGRLRLSNAETERMSRALAASARMRPGLDETGVRERLYRLGRKAAVDGVLLAWSRDEAGPDDAAWIRLLACMRELPVPVFPIAGRDLLAAGQAPGPELGRRLHALEAHWIDAAFNLDREALLARLAKD